MRLFGSERIARLMDRLGAQEGEMLTHPLITRSIEQAQKRVELQNFQSRKRLLEYDDVMNQQREVIYSLRSFALEGGEELRGEAFKMVEKAVARRVETLLVDFEDATQWDLGLVRQDMLMHYLLTVPELEGHDTPTTIEGVSSAAVGAATRAFEHKAQSLVLETPDGPQDYSGQLLALIMLNVLDEKWKDHLYDLDQLRGAIHYRSWGQKDPLIEYKQEAYTMFVDLMHDIHHTFTERYLRAQLVLNPPAPPPVETGGPGRDADGRARPRRRYNALGILEDVVDDDLATVPDAGETSDPPEAAAHQPAVAAKRPDPMVVGAGRSRSLSQMGSGAAGVAGGVPRDIDWSAVGRNDPCPCGSGKKFKKCHGA